MSLPPPGLPLGAHFNAIPSASVASTPHRGPHALVNACPSGPGGSSLRGAVPRHLALAFTSHRRDRFGRPLPEGEPELVVPAFVSARTLAASGPPILPHTTSDEELAAAKALLSPSRAAAHAVAASTPYVPTPPPAPFHDHVGVQVILDSTPFFPSEASSDRHTTYLPVVLPAMPVEQELREVQASQLVVLAASQVLPPSVLEMEHTISALRALPRPEVDEAAVSQTQESLMREALGLVADRAAFESCVAEVKRWYLDDRVARERVMSEACRWLLNEVTSTDPAAWPGAHAFWVDRMVDAFANRYLTFHMMEESSLRDATCARGFDLVVLPVPVTYKCRRLFEADTGDKCSHDGSRAPSPTPSFVALPVDLPPIQLDHTFEAIPCDVDDCPAGSSGSESSSTPTAMPVPLLVVDPRPVVDVSKVLAATAGELWPAPLTPVVAPMPSCPPSPMGLNIPLPQTTPTEWLPTDTESGPSGQIVIPSVPKGHTPIVTNAAPPLCPPMQAPSDSGVASSIHNLANTMAVSPVAAALPLLPARMAPPLPPPVPVPDMTGLLTAIFQTLDRLTSEMALMREARGCVKRATGGDQCEP